MAYKLSELIDLQNATDVIQYSIEMEKCSSQVLDHSATVAIYLKLLKEYKYNEYKVKYKLFLFILSYFLGVHSITFMINFNNEKINGNKKCISREERNEDKNH